MTQEHTQYMQEQLKQIEAALDQLAPQYEQAERQKCRAAYLKAFRTQMRAQLTQTIVEYPDGTCVPLTETTKKKS